MEEKYSFYYNQLKDHKLQIVEDGERVKSFYLKKDGSRMMSSMIIFTPEGIAIMGDLTPERNGSISSYGYGLEWFSSRDMYPSYFASKFLEKKFIPEKAIAFLEELLSSMKSQETDEIEIADLEKQQDNLAFIKDSLSHGDIGPEYFYRELEDLGLYDLDGVGYDYKESEIGWLYAIQKRFSELYHEQMSS